MFGIDSVIDGKSPSFDSLDSDWMFVEDWDRELIVSLVEISLFDRDNNYYANVFDNEEFVSSFVDMLHDICEKINDKISD